jgi:hypothetical protein
MPQLRKLKIPAKMNQAHRSWALLIGHMANEMNCLVKLVLWSHPQGISDPKDPFVVGAAAQAMILTKLLMGKQWEAYKVLEASYFDKPLQMVLRKRMMPKALEAEAHIRREFASEDSIHAKVRNRFAFHYSLSEFGRQYPVAKKAEDLFIFLADRRNNVLYDAAETVVNRAMLSHVDQDVPLAVTKVIEAGVDATAWFGDFCEGFVNAVLINALGEPESWAALETASVSGPSFDDVRIPWFTEP